VRQQQFQVGDWVWYHYPRRYKHKSQKWQKRYTGPFLLVRVILPSNYVLQKSPRSKAFVVSAGKLKKCFGDTPTSWLSPVKVTGTEPPLDPPEVRPTCSVLPDNVSLHRQPRGRRRREPLSHGDAVSEIQSDDPDGVPCRRRLARKHRRPGHFEDYVCDTVKLCCNSLTRVAVC